MAERLGNALIVGGLVVLGLGVLVRVGAFRWFGRLPGDLRVETESVRVYVPLASMLLLSLLLTLLLNLWRRL